MRALEDRQLGYVWRVAADGSRNSAATRRRGVALRQSRQSENRKQQQQQQQKPRLHETIVMSDWQGSQAAGKIPGAVSPERAAIREYFASHGLLELYDAIEKAR